MSLLATLQAAKDPLKFTSPLFTKGEPVDFYLFLAEQPFVSGGYNMQDLIWSETGVSLALKEPRNISYVYEPSKVGALIRERSHCSHVAARTARYTRRQPSERHVVGSTPS